MLPSLKEWACAVAGKRTARRKVLRFISLF
jgi:hypothetical protein